MLTITTAGETILFDSVDNDSLAMKIELRCEGRSWRGNLEPVTVEQPTHRQWSIKFNDSAAQSPLVAELRAHKIPETEIYSLEFSIRNPQPMDHPGGNWDLGAAGSIVIEELAVWFEYKNKANEVGISSGEKPAADFEFTSKKSVKIFQASSGGENWDSSNHLDSTGRVPLEFRGYRMTVDGTEHSGLRAQPTVTAGCSETQVSVAVRNFWQNFPLAISADLKGIRVAFFPSEHRSGVELQGGEQKTYQLAVEMRPAGTEFGIQNVLHPATPPLDSNFRGKVEAWPYLTQRSSAGDSRYEALVDLAIEGDDTFAIKAEKIDQFGWRNFGDLYGDHEAVYSDGDRPMISHYNNQYDCTLGFAIQYLRSGDKRWFDLMTEMADHAWDIDTYHTDQDKLLYNGGLFWHTYHYADAHTATHRSYPKRLRVSQSFDGGQELAELGETGEELSKNYAIGGGPAAAHNYSTGWMLAYYLTGTERYRTAAINAANYVMQIEDGNKTPFKWLARSDTGYSTCSSDGYYGPGRAAANSTHALLTGHELTGNDKYLQRAELLMRRTVHPEENLESLDLLNAELRWFYTMYLQALARYVDYKIALDQKDDAFEYGVATLLHYAHWMAENERPTLARPDELQYPTETWAAQDMRKWHVLQHATLYETDLDNRKKLQQKADFFYEYAINYLTESPTRSLCRPIILLLNFGWQRDWFTQNKDCCFLDSPIKSSFATQDQFVPQRAIAIGRLKKIISGGIGLAVASTVLLIVWQVSRWFN